MANGFYAFYGGWLDELDDDLLDELDKFGVIKPSSEPYVAPDIVGTKKCECGAESVGSKIHSDWCPKYEKKYAN